MPNFMGHNMFIKNVLVFRRFRVAMQSNSASRIFGLQFGLQHYRSSNILNSKHEMLFHICIFILLQNHSIAVEKLKLCLIWTQIFSLSSQLCPVKSMWLWQYRTETAFSPTNIPLKEQTSLCFSFRDLFNSLPILFTFGGGKMNLGTYSALSPFVLLWL